MTSRCSVDKGTDNSLLIESYRLLQSVDNKAGCFSGRKKRDSSPD